ncbi:MAG: helix-turn-helix domain-containing protein, partial [Atribacterota bacterium]
SESPIYGEKYRKYGNIGNTSNTPTTYDPPLADTASHAASVPFVTPEVSLSVTEKRNNVTRNVTGKRCSVCLHPERTHIEEALQSGVSLRQVAKRFGVCYASIYRHQKKHMGNSSEPSLQSFDDWPFGERGEEYVEVLID